MTSQAIMESTIFLEKRVFHHDYVPEHIVHRQRQIERIHAILSDTERQVRPRNILCIGSFGTGKTVVVRRFCQTLTDGIASVYVNCSEQNTQSRIMREVLRQLGSPVKPGFPKDYYLASFKETVQKQPWLILVLDEVDRFIDRKDSEYDELFYKLSRSIPNAIAVLLTNCVDLEQRLQVILDSRVKDTFRYERVEFPDYTAFELMDILRERCQMGLRAGSYDEGIIAMTGRKAYELGLRARGLLDTARKAEELAEAQARATITEQDVRDAVRELFHEQDIEVVQRLPAIQKALLRRILQSGSILTQQLYDWYSKELCRSLGGAPHTRVTTTRSNNSQPKD